MTAQEIKERQEAYDYVRRHNWQSGWRTFIGSFGGIGPAFREMMRRWPGLWFLLCELLPVRVWQTTGPDGYGPWEYSPADAAEFVSSESKYYASQDDGVEVNFPPDEVTGLRWPGQKIERNDWGIQCIVIPRWKLSREWHGW